MNMQNTKTRREAAFLVTIVFALGVLLGGLGTHLWGESEKVWGHQTSPKTRDEIVARLTHEVDLTPDQQKQVTAIVDDTRAQWKALYAPVDAQKEQIRQQSREKLRALMTPEQKVKLENFFHEIDEQRQKDAAAAAH
jgi:Spy/CpxP family protein refolding chaperone